MSSTMRAKMRVNSVATLSDGSEALQLFAVGKNGSYDEGGKDEDNTFASYTPSAELNLTVNNPDLTGQIKEGQTFYVDFTPAD